MYDPATAVYGAWALGSWPTRRESDASASLTDDCTDSELTAAGPTVDCGAVEGEVMVRCSEEDGDYEEAVWTFADDDDDNMLQQIPSSVFEHPGERIAFYYWVKHLSGVLPAYDSACNNPYRQMSYLALSSPMLMNTIISLSTEYMYNQHRMTTEVTLVRRGKALASLREALQNAFSHNTTDMQQRHLRDMYGEVSETQAILAAVLLQITNVMLTGGSGSGVDAHLAYAMHLLKSLSYLDGPVQEFLPRLLVQRFAMIDVSIAIYRYTRPKLPLSFWLFTPDEGQDRVHPSFREMTGCPQPLLGILARIAHLAADRDDHRRNSGTDDKSFEPVDNDDAFIISMHSSTLETDLRIYGRAHASVSNTRTSSVRYLDMLGECFYWSAHLLLQRLVYEDETNSMRVQAAVANIARCIKRLPVGCGPDSSIQFPFYVSSREAVTESHRMWVREYNAALKAKYPSRLRDATIASLDELWKVADEDRELREELHKRRNDSVRDLEQDKDLLFL